MYSLRRWIFRPKRNDEAYLAQFYYADEELNMVASELDSFDGKKDPERCTALVNQLRQSQDKVLSIVEKIMNDVIPHNRANRDFRVKFPDEVLQDTLAGQLWFGAECLAAGSSIMNREVESASMRPLAKLLTRHLDHLRSLLREQCLKNQNTYTEVIRDALIEFDKLFAEFELSYVSAMVPVKTMAEYDLLQDIGVLYCETVHRALRSSLLSQDQIEMYDPALMFTIPRLAIICGLVVYPEGPLNPDMDPMNMSEMFKPFQTLLYKIRELLWTLTADELRRLEKALCDTDGPVSRHLSQDESSQLAAHEQILVDLTTEDPDLAVRTAVDRDCDWQGLDSSGGGESGLDYFMAHSDSTLTVIASGGQSDPAQSPKRNCTNERCECRGEVFEEGCANCTNQMTEQNLTENSETSLKNNNAENEISCQGRNNQQLSQNVPGNQTCAQTADGDSNINGKRVGWSDQSNGGDRGDDCVAEARTNRDYHHSMSWPEAVVKRVSSSNRTSHNNPSNVSRGESTHNSMSDISFGELGSREFSIHLPCNTSSEHVDAGNTRPRSASSSGVGEQRIIFISSGSTGTCDNETAATPDSSQVSFVTDTLCQLFYADTSFNDETTIGDPPPSTSITTNEQIVTADDNHPPCYSSAPDIRVVTSTPQLMDVTSNIVLLNGADSLISSTGDSTTLTIPTSPNSVDTLRDSNDKKLGPPRRLPSHENSCLGQTTGASSDDVRLENEKNKGVQLKLSVAMDMESTGENIVNRESCSNYTGSETSSCTSDSVDDEEIALAIQAAELAARREARSKFKSSNDLIHRLFVCISGVADQLQSNYANDQRHLLKMVFQCYAMDCMAEDDDDDGDKDEADIATEADELCDIEDDADLEEGDTGIDSTGSLNSSSYRGPPVWVPDDQSPQCTSCKASFTFVRRRHHCRNCGKIFCDRCSSNSVPLPHYGHDKPVRICNHCFMFRVTPFTVL